ncbi:IS110 family transposase [Fervidobacterium nodosum]|uniref:Transposase n=1 Tax=Fervidobacterium nodosum (strain ATCC 35602 / DSM 5306 / Rt17-B1) TaxID=381764 RepID=A7HMX2_FERNB|nr:transposase [Fervidobacterium nodosum]ABS61255.1 transposase [Fervidobacterium nodosum Rt17-B1]
MDSKVFSVFVGIDVSNGNFNACVIHNPNSIIFEKDFEISNQGFSSFAESLSSFPKDSIVLTLESTACNQVNLLSFLVKDFSCVAFKPLNVKDSPCDSFRKTENEKSHAYSIACTLFYFQEQLSSSSFLDTEFRDVVIERERVIQEISESKSEIKQLLIVLFPELERFTNIYSDSTLEFLLSFPSAKAIQKTSLEALKAYYSEAIGREPNISPVFLKELADNSIAQYWPLNEKLLIHEIERLRLYQQQLKEYEGILTQFCECYSIDVSNLNNNG